MDNDLLRELAMLISPFIGVIGVGFWFKRWVSSIDVKIDELAKDVHSLSVQLAVSKAEKIQYENSIEKLHHCVNETNSEIEKLKVSIDALWKVLQRNEKLSIVSRLSDA